MDPFAIDYSMARACGVVEKGVASGSGWFHDQAVSQCGYWLFFAVRLRCREAIGMTWAEPAETTAPAVRGV